MLNILEELKLHNLSESDILWVGSNKLNFMLSWTDFNKQYGSADPTDLLVVGNNWSMQYNSGKWQFRSLLKYGDKWFVTLHNGKKVKLGRIRPKIKPNVLRLASYLKAGIEPPTSVDYSQKAMASISHMYLNDQLGCCVISGKGHSVGVWSGNESGTPIIATDNEIYSAYQGICGPGDNGCVITDVLDYMKSSGMMLGGQRRKIDGYVGVDWTNQNEVKVALYLFGTLTLGINLPSEWQSAPDIWDVTNTQIIGGHDTSAISYNSQGVVVSTWGSTRLITWQAFLSKQWIDECYVILSPDWYANANLSPSGLDVTSLKADLDQIGGGVIPPITPPNPVPVPPIPVPIPTPIPVPVPVPPIPTPIPVPVPTPPPTPIPVPLPPAITLNAAIKAITDGIERNRPYGLFNVADKVEFVAISALKEAWPH